MAWIKREDLCKPRRDGGLGFRNLQSFKKALLCKWMWRFIKDKNSLWIRVVASRHGEPRLASKGLSGVKEGRRKTGWWKNVLAHGRWFWDRVHRKLGNGKNTNFWEGAWSGESSVKSLFPYLFHLSAKRGATINEMGRWNDGRWTWKVEWRREV